MELYVLCESEKVLSRMVSLNIWHHFLFQSRLLSAVVSLLFQRLFWCALVSKSAPRYWDSITIISFSGLAIETSLNIVQSLSTDFLLLSRISICWPLVFLHILFLNELSSNCCVAADVFLACCPPVLLHCFVFLFWHSLLLSRCVCVCVSIQTLLLTRCSVAVVCCVSMT